MHRPADADVVRDGLDVDSATVGGQSTTRPASPLPAPAWRGRVAVVSPHLDDAAFSVGASIRAATRRRVQVDVVTVLSGDPDSRTPADEHNRRAGFETAGEAARLRRDEDRRACEHLGATPVWLPLSDDDNEERDVEVVRHSLREALQPHDAVLLPGFPLAHPDHRLVTGLALEVLRPGRHVGLYVEQPYASWHALTRGGRGTTSRHGALPSVGLGATAEARWTSHAGRAADWIAKTKAMSAYASQLAVLRRAPRTRILAYEALHGGEAVLWLRLG